MTQNSDSENTENSPPKDGGNEWAKNFLRRLSRALRLKRDGVLLITVSIVTATAGIAGSWIAANGAYDAALAEQKESRRTALEKEARDKRAEVYMKYLEAANEYQLKNEKMMLSLEKMRSSSKPNELDMEAYNVWLTARADYQGAVNEVYIYGSDEAWNSTRKISESLPRSIGSKIEFESTNYETFREGYIRFLERIRCEVPPARSSKCRR